MSIALKKRTLEKDGSATLCQRWPQNSHNPTTRPSELRCRFHHRRKCGGFHIRRNILFLEHVVGVLGIRVDVEEPLHLVNPRFAQDLRIDFAKRKPIVSKAQANTIHVAKLDGFLGARLAQRVVVFAAFGSCALVHAPPRMWRLKPE